MYYYRSITSKLEKIASLYKAVLVTGVRQAGKTELVRHCFDTHTWTLLDRAAVISEAKRDPALFIQNHPTPCIYDEVQRVPELFLELKDLIDSKQLPNGSVVLSGSQPLALMKAVSDSLAGRIGIVELFPMTPAEVAKETATDTQKNTAPKHPLRTFSNWLEHPPLGQRFPWKMATAEAVFRGGFPAMALLEHSPDQNAAAQRLSDYVQTFLSRDLRDLSAVSDLGRFEKFLRFIANTSGRLLNIELLSRDSGIPQSTIQDWLSILEAAYIVKLLPGYHSTLTKRETKRPKLVLCDSGLMLHLLGYRNVALASESPNFGAAFITMGIQAVLSTINQDSVRPPVYHWRKGEKNEVDMVVELTPEAIIPIEFKYTAHPTIEDVAAIIKFQKIYSRCKTGILITTCEECFKLSENVLHIPLSAL